MSNKDRTDRSGEDLTEAQRENVEKRDRRAAQVLAEYQDSFAAGKSSSWRQFLNENPDCTDLRDEFEVLEQVDTLFDEGVLGAPLTRLGDFVLVRVLGEGGMGVVYEAYQVSLSRRVALKVVSPKYLDSAKTSERFLKKEIIAQGRLSHPNIVPIYSTGVEGRIPYFAMEYCKGQTLQDWLNRLRTKERERKEGLPADAEDEPVIRELYTPGDGSEFDDPVFDDMLYDGPMYGRTLSDATFFDGAGWDGPGLDGLSSEDRGNVVDVGAAMETAGELPGAVAAAGGTEIEAVNPLQSPTGDRDLSFEHCRRIAKAFIGVAEALYHAHVHSVIHRDIKPSNLIFDATGNLRILDFGLALMLDDPSRFTRSGAVPMGTLPYMSPEQIQGERKLYGPASDIYSLGATLYEMVTGTIPFEAADFQGYVRKTVSENPEPPSRRNPQVPRKLQTIILRCLEKQRERRYPTAHVLALDLQNFLDGNDLIIRPDPRYVRAARTAWRIRWGLLATACALTLAVVSGLLYRIHAENRGDEEQKTYDDTIEAAAAEIQTQQLDLGTAVSNMRVKRLPRDSSAAPDAVRDVHRGGDDLLFDVQASDYQQWVQSSSDAALVRRSKVNQALRKLKDASGLLPHRPEADFYASQGLLLLGDIEGAQERLVSVLGNDSVRGKQPNSLLVLGLQLQLLTVQGRRGEALQVEKQFKKVAAKGGPAWALPWLNVLKAEAEMDWETVATACDEVGRHLDPSQDGWQEKALVREVILKMTDAGLRTSRNNFARRRNEEAQRVLEMVSLTPLNPKWAGQKHVEFILLQGKTQFLMGNPARAAVVFRRVYDDADQNGNTSSWTPTKVARAIVSLYRDLEDYDSALQWAERVYAREPLNSEASLAIGYIHLTIGQIRMQQEKYIEASQWFDQASRLSPSDARPLAAQALCLEALDMPDEAERKLQDIVSSSLLNQGPAYYFWAWFLSKQGQGKSKEAEQKCREAIQVDPANALAHNLLGQLLDAQGELEAAKEEYEKATKHDPRFGVAHYHLGWAYHRQRMFAEAASHYRMALANGIADPVVLGNLAPCLQVLDGSDDSQIQKTFDDAIAAYQEALEGNQGNAVIHLSLGSAYEWRHRTTRSSEDLEKAVASHKLAVDLDEDWIRPRFYLAGDLLELKRRTEAYEQYAEIHRRAPDYFPARQLMAMIWLEENWPLPTGEDLWETIAHLEAAVALSPDAESAGERLLGMCRRSLSPDLATYGSIDALFDDPEMLIPEGARWVRWLASSEEPPAGWSGLGFDDRSWVPGPGSFGFPEGVHGIGTVLSDMQGAYSSVYLRHHFVAADRTRLGRVILAVRGDDGYAAFLNGVEVARKEAEDPDSPGTPRVEGIAVHCEQYLIDPGLLRDEGNLLALHGRNFRPDDVDFFLGATLKSASFDPEARKRAVQEAYAAFQIVATGPTAPARLAHFEGRLCQLWGNHGEAITSFQNVLKADLTRPEPFLRLAESLVALERAEEGEAVLRKGSETVSAGYDRILEAWFRCVMLGARWSEKRALDSFPKAPKKLPEVWESYRWLLTDLRDRKAVRINCGGAAFKGRGKSWGRDRFHRGGGERYLKRLQRDVAGSYDPDAALEDQPLYLTAREFGSGAPIMPGYSIPLPPGTYAVTLHFIEGSDDRDTDRRRFAVLIEGEVRLPDCEPMRNGYGVPELREVRVEVKDGALDLEFIRNPRKLGPQLSAIEIVPVLP